jgi:hypothetical protein
MRRRVGPAEGATRAAATVLDHRIAAPGAPPGVVIEHIDGLELVRRADRPLLHLITLAPLRAARVGIPIGDPAALEQRPARAHVGADVLIPGVRWWIAGSAEARDRQLVLGVRQVHVQAVAHALQVVGALGGHGLVLGLAQGRQQHGRQDRDDGDDHQQLDQREGQPGGRGSEVRLFHMRFGLWLRLRRVAGDRPGRVTGPPGKPCVSGDRKRTSCRPAPGARPE